MGYLFGQKRRKVGRLQRRAARCFLVTQEASSVELGTWCWPRVVLIEKRPLTECERSSMNRAARSVGACRDVAIRRLRPQDNWDLAIAGYGAARCRTQGWGLCPAVPAMTLREALGVVLDALAGRSLTRRPHKSP